MMTTPRARKSTTSRRPRRIAATDQDRPRLTYNDVARRAYELFLERGGTHGRDWDDWFSAERQLSSAEP